jgi:hypothetical protein
MAQITLDLNRFKASGVYTIEIDASESLVISTQTIRLVVGFSRVGPFNAPVFLRDIKTARRIFGSIDTILESKGSFFHRALETCLSVGPIYALNLLPLNNAPANEGGDAVDFKCFALAANEQNGNNTRALYSSFYNKERFWFPDTSYLQATVDIKPTNRGRLFNVVSLGQQVVSFLVKKSNNVTQYSVTAKEYYGPDEIPAYIKPSDFLSDYFVDIYVIKGDWTNLQLLSQDPTYSKYFDRRGVMANRLEQFVSLDEITLIGSFTGCIIPDFLDNNGVNQSIDTIVNSSIALTGMFMTINEAELSDYANSTYKVDMVGHSLINTTDDTIDFLSYNTPIKSVLGFTGGDANLSGESVIQAFDATSGSVPPYVRSFPYGKASGNFANILALPKPLPSDTTFTVAQWEYLADNLNSTSLIGTNGTDTINDSDRPNDFVKVDNVIDTGSELLIQLSTPAHLDSNYQNSFGSGPESNYIESTTAILLPTLANTIEINNYTNLTPAINDVILVQFPGYAKYFEVATVTIAATTTITVSTAVTPGAPFNLDKWCVAGFPADDFSAVLQPSTINVTLFQATNVASELLAPALNIFPGSQFSYIVYPLSQHNSIEGLGQTALAASENLVTLFNETQGIAYANANVLDPGPGISAYDVDSTSVTFRQVRLFDNATGSNPFNGVGATVGDIIRVTLPGGGIFRGLVSDTAAAPALYNLNVSDITKLAYVEAYPNAKMSKDIKGNLFVDGDRIKYGIGGSMFNYVNVDSAWNKSLDISSKIAYGLVGTRVRQFIDTALLSNADSTYASLNNTYIDAVQQIAPLGESNLSVYSATAKNISEQVAIEAPGLYSGGKKFNLNVTNAGKIEIGDFVVNNDVNNPILVRVIGKVRKLDPATGVPYFEYSVLESPAVTTTSGTNYVTKFIPIQKFVDRYQFTSFTGFKMNEYHMPGTPAQLEKILSVLETTNVGETLASKDVIQFRYVIDTFNGGLEPGMGPKQYISRLAARRQQCMALLNAPSIAEFQASTDPRFTELPDPAAGNPKPVLNTEYIATGGNLTLGPSFRWTLPDEENGAKFIGVFTPNVILRENGKNKSIPPAAHVSNNFIRKFINGEPYAIVAGPRRGVISDPKFVGLEYDFLLKDREFLEPIGLNPIVAVRNVGPMIFANQTAYQRTVSAFNNLHVRDLLITVEDAVIDILQNYLFEFNDAATRLTIRTLVETYLDLVRNGGGIYDYAVIMDESNNTPDIIDQNFGILDIGIEPARGLQKFINRITVLKTGGIASGGFAAV